MPATDPSQPARAPERASTGPAPTGPAPTGGRAGRRSGAPWLGLVALLVTTSALAACSAAGDAASGPAVVESRTGDGGADAGAARSPDPTEADEAGDDPAGVDVAGVAARPSDRRVRSADVTLEVPDLAAGAARVRRLAGEHDGYVATEALGLRAATPGAGDATGAPGVETGDAALAPQVPDVAPWPPVAPGQARLVLRVPQALLDEAVAALATVGTEIGRWTSDRVVEADLVDLDARIATATRSVARVRDLLAEAGSLEDVLALEVEVARREADLEALRARRDTLAGQAAQATLSVTLLTPDAAAAGAGAGGFAGGLAAGWEALVAAASVALTALGAALPFAAVAAVVVVPLLVRSRRRRGPRAAAT